MSRDAIGKIKRGKANPTRPASAQLSSGLGMTLDRFTQHLEDQDDEPIHALRG